VNKEKEVLININSVQHASDSLINHNETHDPTHLTSPASHRISPPAK
jgi:hypothetical protein